MKRVSERQQKRLDKYYALVEKDTTIQVCALCGTNGTKNSLERHHPRRRLGNNLFIYEYVCRGCHREIEDGKHLDHLPRDDEHERMFHALKDGQNMLKKQ